MKTLFSSPALGRAINQLRTLDWGRPVRHALPAFKHLEADGFRGLPPLGLDNPTLVMALENPDNPFDAVVVHFQRTGDGMLVGASMALAVGWGASPESLPPLTRDAANIMASMMGPPAAAVDQCEDAVEWLASEDAIWSGGDVPLAAYAQCWSRDTSSPPDLVTNNSVEQDSFQRIVDGIDRPVTASFVFHRLDDENTDEHLNSKKAARFGVAVLLVFCTER